MTNSYLNPFGSDVFTQTPNLDLGFNIPSIPNVPSYGGQVMAPSPQQPGRSFGETALGIGSIAEGIGNVVRSLRGMDPAPPGMATRALSDYFGQKQDTTLEKILDRIFADTQSKFARKEREPSYERETQPAA
jgi:hypothetical protein